MQERIFQEALHQLVDGSVSVAAVERVGGGCISETFRLLVSSENGKQNHWFVKINDSSFLDNFQCERNGLAAIGQSGAIRTPKPIATGLSNDRAWLILEWIDRTTQTSAFFNRLGRQLAELHRCTSGDEIGWRENNFLGTSIQNNTPIGDWVDFFAQHRIESQLKTAVDRHSIPSRLVKDTTSILSQMPSLLSGSEKKTSLIHGDLWSGNYLSDSAGNPVLIDPAIYRGNREAEFGMLRLFGNCPLNFYRAYDQEFPLLEGWQRRCDVYTLYHLLNHLNLFGFGYLDDCTRMCQKILSAR
jgi:fructosamine-3-kinase